MGPAAETISRTARACYSEVRSKGSRRQNAGVLSVLVWEEMGDVNRY